MWGKASRIDFPLMEEQIMGEMKMSREGVTDWKVGEELIIDTEGIPFAKVSSAFPMI